MKYFFVVALQIGEEKLCLIFLVILNLGMGLCKILLITSFAGFGMGLELIDSLYYGCMRRT